jgi:ribosomal protein L11 methyltransferase
LNRFGQTATSYRDADSGEITVTIYFKKPPRWDRRIRAELAAGISALKNFSLEVGREKFSMTRVRRQDWAESWKRHFKPIEIGAALLIKPSWSRRRARKNQAEVVIDPGLSFGTGQHPTTEFCLRQLVVHRRNGEHQSLLDVGTGSGILAIAAAKLGYAPVRAFDYDPEAVRIATANATSNSVHRKICFSRQDVTKLSATSREKFSVICANLISTLLRSDLARILARLERGGVLVVAGILKTEFAEVQAYFEKSRLSLIATRAKGEWRSGAFCWRSF